MIYKKEGIKMDLKLYLLNYSVEGIKTLDQKVSLSFYEETIPRDLDIQKYNDIQEYNVKGIYGMNGSGKSGIVNSVEIFKNLLINPEYLNNPVIQNNLDAIINKKVKKLSIEAQFITNWVPGMIYHYIITLTRDISEKYVISYEKLNARKTNSAADHTETIFKVVDGEIQFAKKNGNDEFLDKMLNKMTNLLSKSSMCALFQYKVFVYLLKEMRNKNKAVVNDLFAGLILLMTLGTKLHVYLDESDDHRKYFVTKSFETPDSTENNIPLFNEMMRCFFETDSDCLNIISVSGNLVSKKAYKDYKRTVANLCEFLQIFKSDLQDIEIYKRENQDGYVCNLIMVYDSYKIHAEFESTGIKKLIKLFAYLREMVHGGIVFIDEFDSNLHDVYLCALLEYLMEYGKGQLCFTTHNLGPMDILKRRKKSIDFLSADHKIYPWIKSGNYSPSKLYRNGMIEGSPFNVDSTDFIGIFGSGEEND